MTKIPTGHEGVGAGAIPPLRGLSRGYAILGLATRDAGEKEMAGTRPMAGAGGRANTYLPALPRRLVAAMAAAAADDALPPF